MSDIAMNEFNVKGIQKYMPLILSAGRVPYVTGSPGEGKSSLVKEYADKLNLKLIDVRLSMLDSLDVSGLPKLGKHSFSHLPMDIFPTDKTSIPKGYKGWLLFFDELALASLSVKKAAYKILLDRMVGNYDLHEKVQMVAAGNLTTDGADATKLNTALSSRLIHLRLKPMTAKYWLDWAYANNMDYRVTSFLESSPDMISTFDPEQDTDTFACARTYEFLSDILKEIPDLTPDETPLLCGTIGDNAGIAFSTFMQYSNQIIDVNDVIKSPKSAKIDSNLSVQYITLSYLAHKTTAKNLKKISKYVNRHSTELQVMFYMMIVRITPKISKEKIISDWLLNNKDSLV